MAPLLFALAAIDSINKIWVLSHVTDAVAQTLVWAIAITISIYVITSINLLVSILFEFENIQIRSKLLSITEYKLIYKSIFNSGLLSGGNGFNKLTQILNEQKSRLL